MIYFNSSMDVVGCIIREGVDVDATSSMKTYSSSGLGSSTIVSGTDFQSFAVAETAFCLGDMLTRGTNVIFHKKKGQK